jgi:hypothetical protein
VVFDKTKFRPIPGVFPQGKDKLYMHNIANKQRAPDANGKIISLD